MIPFISNLLCLISGCISFHNLIQFFANHMAMSMRHTFKALWRAERERVSYICSIVYLWKNSLEGTVQRAATYVYYIIHKTMCCTYGGLASLTRQHACWHASTHAECSVMGLKHALPACSFGPRPVVACVRSLVCLYGWRRWRTMGQNKKT